jgi:hypothetical protein
MAVSAAQRAQLAWNAGFRNTVERESLSIMVAISLAECGVGSSSGCETGCVDVEGDLTCGVVQVDCRTSSYGSACTTCSAPAAAFACAWHISSGGTSFSAWATYTGGEFSQYLPTARAAIAATVCAPAPAAVSTVSTEPPPPPPPAQPAPPAGVDTGAVAIAILAAAGIVGTLYATGHPALLSMLRTPPGGAVRFSLAPLLRPS